MPSDKERYATISITDDEEEFDKKSFFAKTLEIPRVVLNKRRSLRLLKLDMFSKAVRYKPSPAEGLNSYQVEERQKNRLVNKQAKKISKSYVEIILENVLTFFNILLISIAVALISVGDYKDCFFLAIIFANTLIGIIQEVRAKQIVDRLSLINVSEVKVRRDSKKMKIHTEDMVLDDIFYLTSGNEIPADSYIVKGDIEVNESTLTGESLPIKKAVGDYVLAGSFVVSGSCMCRCDRIGEHNYVAQLQNKARKVKKVNSVLLTSLKKLIRYISAIVLPVGAIIALSYYLDGEEMAFTIRKTGAQIVTMIPSGLFLLISTTLTVSVINLAKKKTMVQDSYAIESLARSNVICLDKTGTITDGTMRVEREVKITPKAIDIPSTISSYLSAFDDANVTSVALAKQYGKKCNKKISKILPFSSSRKLSAVEFENEGTYVLGAPEFVSKDKKIIAAAESYTQGGYRVLLLGHLDQGLVDDMVFKNVQPVAFFVLSDHIRKEAPATIKWFAKNKVQVRIISGDNPKTVSQIAEKVGVEGADKYISLDGMSNDEVAAIANDYIVFGRVSPEQKAVLIKTIKNAGNTVAMTGDGVNDILAMKQSNCSIAMSGGAEAARNAAHVVLMDSNFASMPEVIKEGRKVINNIQKSAALFLMKTTFSVCFAALGLISFGLRYFNVADVNLNQPLDLNQLYVLEFFVIGVPSVILALQPNHNLISGTFMKNVFMKALPGGLSLLFSVLIIVILSNIPSIIPPGSNDIVSTMGSISLSITGMFILFEICRPLTILSAITWVLMMGATVVWIVAIPESFNSLYLTKMTPLYWLILGGTIFLSVVRYLIIWIKAISGKKHA